MSNQAVEVHRKYYRGKKSDLTDWVQEKLHARIGLHQIFMWAFLNDFLPGLTVVYYNSNLITTLDELLCKLCGHIACKVYQCDKCLSFYCQDCLKILVETYRFIGRLPPLDNASPFREKFYCMVCTNQVTPPKVMGINRKAKEIFESLRVRCQRYECEFEGTYINLVAHINTSDCYNTMTDVKINMKMFHDFGRRKYPMEWPTNIEYSLSTDENTNFIKRFTDQLVIATENDYLMLTQPGPSKPSSSGATRLCPIPQLQRNQCANLTQEEIDNLRKAAAAEREAQKKKLEDEQKEKERLWAIEGRDLMDCLDIAPSSPVDWSDLGSVPSNPLPKGPRPPRPASPRTVEKRKRSFKEILELGRKRREEEAKEKEAREKAAKENKDKPKQTSSTIVPEKRVLTEQEKSFAQRLLDHMSLASFGTKKVTEVTEKSTESEAGVRTPRATSEPTKEVEPVEPVKSTESTTQSEKPSTSQEKAQEQPRLTTIIEPCSPPRPSGSQEISVIDQILSEAEPIHWDSEEPQEDIDDEEEEDKEIKLGKLDRNLIKQHEGEPLRKRSRQEIIEKARQEGLSKDKTKKRLQRNAKREKENLRRKQQRERKMQQVINSISNVHNNIKAGVHEERINNAFKELNKQGKRVCGFDVEKINIVTQFYGVRSLPVWIGIVDGAGNARMNKIVRYPKHSIQDFNTVFHGLTWEHLKDAQNFYEIREEAVEILLQYDIICVAGGLNDFISLCINEEDWIKIRPRVRDVNQYYNPRLAMNETIGLRFTTFIFFQQIIQDGAHSPIVDATYTLFLYLIDHEKFEEEFNQVKNGPFTPNPFPNYIYPRNTQMATLLKEVMKIIKDWPNKLRMRANPKWKWTPSYDPAAIIDGDRILRAPYSLNVNRLFTKWKK